MKSRYFFNNVDDLIAYIYTKTDDISPVKLQKGLYFLYAYYSIMYNRPEDDSELERPYNLPPELFPAEFQAWMFGPVLPEVYDKRKANEEFFPNLAKTLDLATLFSGKEGKEVQTFIDDFLFQIFNTSDFALVDRSHMDKCWKDAYAKGKSTPIEAQAIMDEYKVKFAQRSWVYLNRSRLKNRVEYNDLISSSYLRVNYIPIDCCLGQLMKKYVELVSDQTSIVQKSFWNRRKREWEITLFLYIYDHISHNLK